MSNERDRARLISEYADDLIARRRTERPPTERGTESDMSRMLEVTRTLSEIEFEMPAGLTAEVQPNLQALAQRHRQPSGWWLRGVAAAAAIAVALVTVLFLVRREPIVSAAELLTSSTEAERARIEQPGLVARRTFTVEARRATDQRPMASQRVELWVDAKAGVSARRVFDQSQALQAAEFTYPDRSRVVYERGKSPRRESTADPKPITVATMWRWDPSAADFANLAGTVDRVSARHTDDGFALSATDAPNGVSQLELTLDKNRVAVAQRVVLREQGELIEINTVRREAEEVPVAQVARASFEPEPELLPASTTIVTRTTPPAPSLSTEPPDTSLTEQAIDALELNAWYQLHHLAGCLARPGELTRSARQLRVAVVAASESCRAQAGRSLADLAGTPGVIVDLSAVTPPAASLPQVPVDPGAPRVAAASDLDSDAALATIPVYRMLYDFHARQALRDPQSSRDLDAVVNPLIRRQAVWVHDRSARRLAVVRELHRLAERWSPETLKPLGLDAASKWQSMVRDHARTLADDTELLVTQLEPALDAATTATPDANVRTIRNLADVRDAIAELNILVESDEREIRRLFTPPGRDGGPQALSERERVIQSLRLAARIATRLTEPWALNQ